MMVKVNDFIVVVILVVVDGISKVVYKLKVIDKQGNVVSGVVVEWLSNIGFFVQGSSIIIDINGEIFIELVSIKVEMVKVMVIVGGKFYNVGKVVFVVDC